MTLEAHKAALGLLARVEASDSQLESMGTILDAVLYPVRLLDFDRRAIARVPDAADTCHGARPLPMCVPSATQAPVTPAATPIPSLRRVHSGDDGDDDEERREDGDEERTGDTSEEDRHVQREKSYENEDVDRDEDNDNDDDDDEEDEDDMDVDMF